MDPNPPPPDHHERLEAFDWPTDAQSYQLLGKIGRGAFATVYKAIPKTAPLPDTVAPEQQSPKEASATPPPLLHNHQDDDYACGVKILNLDHVDSDLQEIRREVQALRLASHANILTCYRAFVHDIHLWLITTLMRKGSAVHCLQTARKRYQQQQQQAQQLSELPSLQRQSSSSPQSSPSNVPPLMEPHIFYILQQSLTGLQYIHETQHAIHRDCKGGNILIDSDGSVRIADFGVSQWLMNYSTPGSTGGAAKEKARTFVGTPCWMAPEVMEQHEQGYDQTADIWSMGITALELAKGYAPYAKYPPMKVLILTIQEDPPSLDTYLTLDDDDDDDDHHDDDEHDVGPNDEGGAGMNQNNNNSKTATNPTTSNRRQPVYVTEDYSKQFVDFVDRCLQKNPSRRPSCADLLQQHPALKQMTNDPAYLQQRRAQMREQVCNVVADVGNVVARTTTTTANNNNNNNNPQNPTDLAAAAAGGGPHHHHHHQQRLHHQQQVKIMFEESSKNQEHVKGTTWVFSDGSQVLSSTALSSDEMSVDDVLDQVEQIGQQHYTDEAANNNNDATLPASGKSALQPSQQQQQQQQQPSSQEPSSSSQALDDSADDDVDAFLSDLEQTLPGEDFQRSKEPPHHG